MGTQILSEEDRYRVVTTLRDLTTERSSILQAMITCMELVHCAADVVQMIVVAISHPTRKLAKLYLISDLLHNCLIPTQPG